MLKHSIQIQEYLTLPTGVYSEEALVGLNKEIRNVRLYHTAKTSRKNTIIYQYHFLIVRSDQFISSIHFINHGEYEGKELPNVVKCLLD